MLETHMKLCVTESHFLEKNCTKKLGKWTKNKSKIVFFEFIEKLDYFLLNLFYYENLYYLTKMVSANQMAGFLNPMGWAWSEMRVFSLITGLCLRNEQTE